LNIKKTIFYVGLILLFFVLIFIVGRIKMVKKIESIRDLKPQDESCIKCHNNFTGFSKYHNPELIGCVACHIGDAHKLEKEAAHKGMISIPGNMEDINFTCGTADCHQDLNGRVKSNIMTTMSGVVSIDKWIFGEYETPDSFSHVKYLKNSPADDHLKKLCASCHLGSPKTELGPIHAKTRGGGCLACHLNYSDSATLQLENYLTNPSTSEQVESLFYHPSVDINVSDDHCFGCHNRSGRISMSYEGYYETLESAEDVKNDSSFRIVTNTRAFKYEESDLHFEAGLSCIDCHLSEGVMGDGNRYLHTEDAVKIGCSDCHKAKEDIDFPVTATLDNEAEKLFSIRSKPRLKGPFLISERSGLPLYNTTKQENNSVRMQGKLNRRIYDVQKRAEICDAGNAHNDLSCNGCHTSWVPRCLGCHTSYDPEQPAYDLLNKERTKGRWVESVDGFAIGKPTLGVRIKNIDKREKREIISMVPGMIMTLDQDDYPGNQGKEESFHRLYAPLFSHTIMSKAYDCKECHNDPVVLGYGEGILEYVTSGKEGEWRFFPEYADLEDELPADAWIGFLKDQNGPFSTRTNIKPFSIDEQKRLLTVASCLECHDGNSSVMLESLVSLDSVMQKMTDDCILPFFN
jgi:hypothetical protein